MWLNLEEKAKSVMVGGSPLALRNTIPTPDIQSNHDYRRNWDTMLHELVNLLNFVRNLLIFCTLGLRLPFLFYSIKKQKMETR